MLFKRTILSAVLVVALCATGCVSDGDGAAQKGGDDESVIHVNIGQVSEGQVLHVLDRLPNGECPAMTPAEETVITLAPNEVSEEITMATNDDCQIIVEQIDKVLLPEASDHDGGVTQDHGGSINWYAYARLRLHGTYTHTDGRKLFAESDTQIDFYLRQTSTGFHFNNPPPEEFCESSGLPTISNRNCRLQWDFNTSQRKQLGAHSEFTFFGEPQMTWDQSATYNARTSGSDQVICENGPRPSFLRRTCTGDRTEE